MSKDEFADIRRYRTSLVLNGCSTLYSNLIDNVNVNNSLTSDVTKFYDNNAVFFK
jgi:hypothetical protein